MNRHDLWTREEVGHFLSASAGTRLEAAWHLAAVARIRTGELLALRWVDVDLVGGRVRVEDAVAGVAYAAISPAPMAARARMIEIDRSLCAILTRHQDCQRAEWDGRYADCGLVVCSEDGRPLHPRHIGRLFKRIAQREGLRPISLPALRRSSHVPVRPEIAA